MTEAFTPADAFGLIRSFTRHVGFVKLALTAVSHDLERRAIRHDLSKMMDDEFSGFARINAAARINKFGSPEYSESMDRERATIDLHFSRNSHHAEHQPQTFLDIIEMVCDWWGAKQGYDDPRAWEATVELNIATKGKYLTSEQRWLVREVSRWVSSEAANLASPPVGQPVVFVASPSERPENTP